VAVHPCLLVPQTATNCHRRAEPILDHSTPHAQTPALASSAKRWFWVENLISVYFISLVWERNKNSRPWWTLPPLVCLDTSNVLPARGPCTQLEPHCDVILRASFQFRDEFSSSLITFLLEGIWFVWLPVSSRARAPCTTFSHPTSPPEDEVAELSRSYCHSHGRYTKCQQQIH